MKYEFQILRKNIDSFLSGKLSKEELGKWAEKAYYDLLRGEYVETSKIVIYPFLQTISRIHVKINDVKDEYPCSKESVKEIQDILHGNQDYDFQVEVAIPFTVYDMFKSEFFDKNKYNFFLEFRSLIQDNINDESMDKNDKNKLVESLNYLADMEISHGTIHGILEERMIMICKALFEFNAFDVCLKKGFKLYPTKSNSLLVDKLVNCIDCYVGEKSFNVIVSFRNGLPHLTVLT